MHVIIFLAEIQIFTNNHFIVILLGSLQIYMVDSGISFSRRFCQPGVLNYDSTVWLDGARPANTCIQLSFLGNMLARLCGLPTPKNMFSSLKKLIPPTNYSAFENCQIVLCNCVIRVKNGFLTRSISAQGILKGEVSLYH